MNSCIVAKAYIEAAQIFELVLRSFVTLCYIALGYL